MNFNKLACLFFVVVIVALAGCKNRNHAHPTVKDDYFIQGKYLNIGISENTAELQSFEKGIKVGKGKVMTLFGKTSADAFDQLVNQEKSKNSSATVQLEYYVKASKPGITLSSRKTELSTVGHVKPPSYFFKLWDIWALIPSPIPTWLIFTNNKVLLTITDETKIKDVVIGTNHDLSFEASSMPDGSVDKEGCFVVKLTVGNYVDIAAFAFKIGDTIGQW